VHHTEPFFFRASHAAVASGMHLLWPCSAI